MENFILAHDLGTSGNKATLFTNEGRLVSSVTESYNTIYKNRNWAEQNPEDWWEAVCLSSQKLLSDIDNKKIACVAFSGQMMGCLCVDLQGTPLYPHLLYCDQRAEKEAFVLADKISINEFYKITGHRPSSSYSLAKLMWIKKNLPAVYENTYKVLNAKDYINFKLTGIMVTDYNDASGTNAFELSSMKWSERIIEASGVEPNLFPDAVPSTQIIGTVTVEASAMTGIPKGTLVVAGAGDGGCATVGAGSVAPGETYCYLGSSSWISTTSKTPVIDPMMKTFTWAHPVPGNYQPCGTMQTAGSSYAWLKNKIAVSESLKAEKDNVSAYSEMNKIALQSPVGANGLIFLPYLCGERSPWWNPNAKGALIGLTLESKRADIFRAVLEGVSMNLDIILKVMQSNIEINDVLLIGGGAKGALWQQILADVFGLPIRVPDYLDEATSMGAAIIGGVGCGVLNDFYDVKKFIRIKHQAEPQYNNSIIYDKIKPIFETCYVSLDKGGVFSANTDMSK